MRTLKEINAEQRALRARLEELRIEKQAFGDASLQAFTVKHFGRELVPGDILVGPNWYGDEEYVWVVDEFCHDSGNAAVRIGSIECGSQAIVRGQLRKMRLASDDDTIIQRAVMWFLHDGRRNDVVLEAPSVTGVQRLLARKARELGVKRTTAWSKSHYRSQAWFRSEKLHLGASIGPVLKK